MSQKRTLVFILVGVLALCAKAPANPEIPGSRQSGPIAIIGGTIHRVSGKSIPNGVVLFDNGKIVKVGTDLELPDNVKVIEANGKHIYPGLIDAFSNIGLVEISAVRATDDRGEVGLLGIENQIVGSLEGCLYLSFNNRAARNTPRCRHADPNA